MRRRARIALVALLALGLAGCGTAGAGGAAGGGKRSDRLVNFKQKPPYVNALDIDPADGQFLLTTNRGFFRIDPKSKKVTQVKGTISAQGKTTTVGTFLELVVSGPKTYIGSGHPDQKGTLPSFLGFIRTDDAGKTWQILSRLGDADLHKIIPAGDKLYAFDAVLGAMLISSDGGRTFTERFTPRGLVIDFVLDPDDPTYMLAATEDQLYRSEDEARKWRPLASGQGIRLTWPEHDMVLRADKDGTIQRSTDRGQTFKTIARVDGEPYKFKTIDAQHHYLALSDGTILETRDGGVKWTTAFKP
ncbi:MAG TPA: hypothetical protein VF533_05710 [Solirubrobacteraceae bacterium]|jgi:hypothetical protein